MSIAQRQLGIKILLAQQPMTLRSLAAAMQEPESRLRYALEMLTFNAEIHIGSWTEHVAGDGRSRLHAVFHLGPGVPAQPPRGKRVVSSQGATIVNRFIDLAQITTQWITATMQQPEADDAN
jgi:hypothetical protein